MQTRQEGCGGKELVKESKLLFCRINPLSFSLHSIAGRRERRTAIACVVNQVDTKQPCSRTSTNDMTLRILRASQLQIFVETSNDASTGGSAFVELAYAIFTNLYRSILLASNPTP